MICQIARFLAREDLVAVGWRTRTLFDTRYWWHNIWLEIAPYRSMDLFGFFFAYWLYMRWPALMVISKYLAYNVMIVFPDRVEQCPRLHEKLRIIKSVTRYACNIPPVHVTATHFRCKWPYKSSRIHLSIQASIVRWITNDRSETSFSSNRCQLWPVAVTSVTYIVLAGQVMWPSNDVTSLVLAPPIC